ncbi:MAG: Uncharacterised protein [Synechococcus sp. MIT S9220]|nr:MAG: Uncharacterised protein [Synechococcus sp. MIT S9220]
MARADGNSSLPPAMTLDILDPARMTSSSADASAKDRDSESIPTTSATTTDVPAFGWSGYAERVNGRFAMIGFLSVLLVEALSHDTFLHWSGLVP